MKRMFALGPWLAELFDPPPRQTLSLGQKSTRALLVTLTLVTICVIVALAISLGCFAWQRSREFLQGVPQVRDDLTILAISAAVNIACILTLLQIKRLDRALIPKPPTAGKDADR